MRAKILNASAGSGKTYQLAYKYVRDVIDQPGLYRHILAVTFTNKATEEMKSRILKEIHRLASGGASPYLGNLCRELSLDERSVRKRAAEVRSKILHDYSRFTVLTIDTFFQRILRAFIKELGIDLNYNVEIETASVLSKGADTLIEQITVDARPATLAHGVRAGAHRRGPQMGHPRRHPFARRRVVQGEEQGRAVGAAVARRTGPDCDRAPRRRPRRPKSNCSRPRARAVAIISGPDVTAADFHGQEPQLRPIISSPSPRAN